MQTTLVPNLNQEREPQKVTRPGSLLLIVMLAMLVCGFLFLDAILPLRGLWFYDALLHTQVGTWLLLPTHLLFPGKATVFFQAGKYTELPASLGTSWKETGLFVAAIVLLFVSYVIALRVLPKRCSLRFVLISTILLGILCMLIPVVTSQDIFSYIIYTRMSVLYHLNPLTTLPIAIRHDALYPYVYWVHQPSAYGPSWVIMTSLLQGIALLGGHTSLLSMVLSLRFTGLLLHLSSALLIWSISGQLQHLNGSLSSSSQNNRMLALLAFAWNPLLLFEACVNAHNDTAILFFVLLVIWALIPRVKGALGFAALAAVLLAIAVGLKITMVVLFPGLLLFLWAQNARRILSLSVVTVTFVGTIILLYAPFWQHGAVLQLFQVNPAAFHTINTPYEFLIRLIASINGFYVVPYSLSKSAPIERIAHGVSILIFVIIYGIMCVRALLPASRLRTLPELIRWLAIVWLLFCLVGAPWFWPWYLITFFGLHALIETSNISGRSILGMFHQPWATRLLTFSMFSTYWFSTIAPLKTAIPYLPHFQWAYFSGLWIWTLPLLALRLQRKPRILVQSWRS